MDAYVTIVTCINQKVIHFQGRNQFGEHGSLNIRIQDFLRGIQRINEIIFQEPLIITLPI